MQTQTKAETVDVESLKTILAAQTDENGLLPDGCNIRIHVRYNPIRGKANSLSRSGDVWAVDEGEFTDKIRFELNGDNFAVELGTTGNELVSYASADGSKLGEIKSVSVEN